MRAAVLTRAAGPAACALVVLLVLAWGTPFWLYNMTIVGITAIAVVGLVVLLGHTGQVSFAQTAFLAVGGYGVGILTTRYGWNPWLALVVSLVLAAVLAVAMGVPTFRLTGHYFAVGTFALALAAFAWVTAAKGVTNGAIGIGGVPEFSIGGLAGRRWSFLLAWLVLGAVIAVGYLLVRSKRGVAWHAIRSNETVAASLGMRTMWLKLAAFVFSAAAATISGGLYVGFGSFVSPDLYGLTPMLDVYLILFLGGFRNLWGPVFGAAIVQLAPQLLTGLGRYQEGVFVLALLVLLLAFRDGLPAGLARLVRWARRLPRHSGRAVTPVEAR